MGWIRTVPEQGLRWIRKGNYVDFVQVQGRYLKGFKVNGAVHDFLGAGWEFLGPATPEQAEQFDALRKAAEDALRYFEDTGESCRTADIVTALRRALGKEQ